MKMLMVLAAVAVLAPGGFSDSEGEDDDDAYNHNQRIRDKVLKNYDKKALPHKDVNGSTTISLDLFITGFNIDDTSQAIIIKGYATMTWADDRLKWDLKEFGGAKKAWFAESEIWKPDIHVYNADSEDIDHYGNVQMTVQNNGSVNWVPPFNCKIPCDLDLTYWPFDKHRCELVMGSWTVRGWQLNIEFMHNYTREVMYFTEHSNGWDMLGSTKRRVSFVYEERFTYVEYMFSLQRKSPTFEAVTIVPAFMVPLLLITQFILPVLHPKRLLIGFLSCIIVLVEMVVLKFTIPRVGRSVPIIVSYYSQCLVLTILTVTVNAILGRLSHPQNPLLATPPPPLIKRILTSPLSYVLCLRDSAITIGMSGTTADSEVLETGKPTDYSLEWLFVAKSVDRLAMILLSTIFIISLLVNVAPVA